MNKEALKLLISPSDIASKVSELAKQILKDHAEEKELILIGTLKGSFIFLADLVRALDKKDVFIDFVRVKSYGYSHTSSEEIVITKDVELPLEGKTVILVEDIVDTGLTVKFLLEHLKLHKPKIVKVCAFIDKRERRKVDMPIDYVGFVVERGFLVGYGLDYAEKYRHLPSVYEVIKS